MKGKIGSVSIHYKNPKDVSIFIYRHYPNRCKLTIYNHVSYPSLQRLQEGIKDFRLEAMNIYDDEILLQFRK